MARPNRLDNLTRMVRDVAERRDENRRLLEAEGDAGRGGPKRARPDRADKRGIVIYVSPATHRALRQRAAQRNESLQSMLSERLMALARR